MYRPILNPPIPHTNRDAIGSAGAYMVHPGYYVLQGQVWAQRQSRHQRARTLLVVALSLHLRLVL